MTALIFASLRARIGTWLGAFMMAVATSAVIGVAVSQMETEAALPEELAGIVSSYSSLMLILALVAAALIMVSVSFRTTTILLPDYALWKLAGVTPRGVRGVVIVQSAIVSFLGAIIGAVIAHPLAQFYFTYASEHSASLDWTDARLSFGAVTVIVAVLATVGCALLASIRGAAVAANTPEIEVLTDTLPMPKPKRLLRWIAGAVLLAGVIVLVYAVSTVTGNPRDVVVSVVGLSIAIGFAVMGVVAVLAPFLLPAIIRAWTAVIPAKLSAVWLMAQRSCIYRVRESSTTVIPLALALGLLGTFFTTLRTGDAALVHIGRLEPGQSTVNIAGGLLVLAGALAVCSIGAAVVILLSNRSRSREYALRRSFGETTTSIFTSAVLEVLVYVITAVIVATAITITTAVVQIIVLAPFIGFVPPTFELVLPLIAALIGVVTIACAILIPSSHSLRADEATTLSND